MGKISVAIGNYSPGGFGGVNTHIAQVLSAAKRYGDINIHPFNLRDSKLSIILQSFHEFTHMRDTPYVTYVSRKFANFDVVHVHASLFSLYAALRARKQYDSSVVVTHHTAADPGVLINKLSGYPYPFRLFYRRFVSGLLGAYSDIDCVIAVARWIQQDLRRYWGVRAEYIPNMVDVNEITRMASHTCCLPKAIPAANYVVWLGARIHPPSIKRPCDFVELARRNPDISFVVVGLRITPDALQQVCGTLPSNIVVVDTSQFDNHRAAFLNIIKHASLAVLTSYYEAFGYAILEALSLGVPVLVPDTGGPPEIVTPSVGAVYRTGDLDSLLDVFLDVWESTINGRYAPEMLQDYVAERYSLHSVAPKILRVYEQL